MMHNILNSKILERFKRFIGLKTGVYLTFKRFTPSASDPLRIATILKHNDIDLVIDIGANTGQFAESLYDFGYSKEVISFEPVSFCHNILRKRSKHNKKWTIAERCAIGEKNGSISINISKGSVFSSILKIKEWYAKSNPVSEVVKTEEVNLFRLDSILEKYSDNLESKKVLLKIDTQGYEQQVLEGASGLFDHVSGIKIEIPLNPIYENVGLTFYKTFSFLEKKGFMPYSFNNEGVNLRTGQVNTIDGLFLKA